jgi:predicted RNA-binding Zn ribbon-like protein
VPYGDYIRADEAAYRQAMGNIARLAVTVANTGRTSDITGVDAELFAEHGVTPPPDAHLEVFLPALREAIGAVADEGDLEAVNTLLDRYPPRLRISAHDGYAHLHHAENGEPGLDWLGRCCAAALAHVACGIPDVTIGRCRADGCANFFVDQSRNRSRRFCSNTCASRTTVAAYRERRRTGKSLSGGTGA